MSEENTVLDNTEQESTVQDNTTQDNSAQDNTEQGNTAHDDKPVKLRGIKNSNEDKPAAMSPMDMHGRRQIFTNEPDITEANVLQELNKALFVHNQNRAEIVYLEKYLRGVQPIMDRVKKFRPEICNRTVVNIANQIVTFKTAAFVGYPIQYVSRGKNESVPAKIEALNGMMLAESKQNRDMRMAYNMFTCGVGYRLVLRDKAGDVANGTLAGEAPFEIYTTDPKNSFVIRLNDVTKRIVAGVNYVMLDSESNSVLYTVYTKDRVYKIEGTMTSADGPITTVVHNMGFVPLIEYPCNNVYMGAFEPVLPLLDLYNLITSNRADGIEQFIQAIMVFEGVDITAEQLEAVKEQGALKIPPSMDGRVGKVYYLNEQLNQEQTQVFINDLYSTILQIVGMPSQGNGNTSDSSNNGAALVKNGWYSADARNLETVGSWDGAETEFLRIVLRICEAANVINGLGVSDIEIKHGKNSYEDLLVKTQSFTTMIGAGAPPVQAYTVSGILNDPEAAAIAFEQYQEVLAEKADEAAGITDTASVPNIVETPIAVEDE